MANLIDFESTLEFGEGNAISYYPNGNIESSEYYSHGSHYRTNFYYYSNGKPKIVLNYFYLNGKLKYTTSHLSDNSGVNLLNEKGNGTVNIQNLDNEEVKGEYKKGFKTGIWTYNSLIDGIVVIENYEKGRLKSGFNKDEYGKSVKYKFLKTLTSLSNKEIEDDNKSFRKNYFELKNKRIDEKGVVRIRFDLYNNGEPDNFDVIKSLSSVSDEAAINLV
jgi:hypothetical protein